MREVSRCGLRLPLMVVTLLTGSAAWRPVLAGPPTGYRCGLGGHPDTAEGACVCPAEWVAHRDGDGTARCMPAPQPRPRRSHRAADRDRRPEHGDRCATESDAADGMAAVDGCPEPAQVATGADALGDDCSADGRGCADGERAAATLDEPSGDSCRDGGAAGEVCDSAGTDEGAEAPDALVAADLEDAPERPIVGFQPVETERDTIRPRLSSRRKASLALGAVGGICLGGALILDLSAHQIYDRSALNYGTQDEAAAYERANRRYLGAQAALGTGLAFGLAAGYLWLTGGSTSSSLPVISIDSRSVHFAVEGAF